MNINRRRFLATSGVSVAAGLLSARTSLSLTSASETPSGPLEWSDVRDQFEVSRYYIHSFEYSWALPAAFAFHQRIGRSRVAQRIHSLNDQCKEGLKRMRQVRLHTPLGAKLSAGLVCFDVDGVKPEQIVSRLLARRIIASTAPYAVSCVRLAPSLLKTPQEIERTLREVRSIAPT